VLEANGGWKKGGYDEEIRFVLGFGSVSVLLADGS
jgi:hypothetical protein